jgi:hypothetical protein
MNMARNEDGTAKPRGRAPLVAARKQAEAELIARHSEAIETRAAELMAELGYQAQTVTKWVKP